MTTRRLILAALLALAVAAPALPALAARHAHRPPPGWTTTTHADGALD